MELKERIKKFIEHLGIETRAFEVRCSLSNGFVNNAGHSIREASLNKIIEVYPELNKNWLITGDGNMLLAESMPEDKSDPLAHHAFSEESVERNKAIPIYDLDISAGTITRLIEDNNNIPLSGWLYLKGAPNTTGLIGVRAKGNSMATFINGGDTMLIRKLENYNFIPPGHAYVIISDELSVVKYIRNGRDNEHWTLRSHNDIYEDFEVKRSDIKHIYIVVKVLKELSY